MVLFATNFIRSSLLVCKFNETIVNATDTQSHLIKCVTPPDVAGSSGGDVAMAVSNNGVEFFTASVNVRFLHTVKVLLM